MLACRPFLWTNIVNINISKENIAKCLLFMISYVALSKIIKLRSDMKIYIYLLAKLKEKVGYVPIILSATPHRIVIHRLWKKKVGIDGSGDQALTCKK